MLAGNGQTAVYLAENAVLDIAERFLEHAKRSINDLTANPIIDATLPLRHSQLPGMCKWRIDAVDNYPIFYLPCPDGVSIAHVLDAARNCVETAGDRGLAANRQG